MYSNVITAVFGASHTARTKSLHQWDYGQVLQFAGVNLPDAYTVHFSNQGVGGEAKTMVGNADGVTIPDEYLTTGQAVYAWVYLHTGADDGETVYSVIIPVIARPRPTEDAPTPVQQGVIDQAIAALNAGVEAAQDAAESVQDMGVVAESLAAGSAATVDKSVDPDTGAITLSFGIPRGDRGEQGPQGVPGERGETGDTGPQGEPGTHGQDGFSPTATVTQTSTGATITVTDAEGTTMAEITNGQDGAPGAPGSPGTPGEDGFSPTITVIDITGGHRVTITDADGPHSFDVMDGDAADAPVQDVQVNGTSILDAQGVANVPISSVSAVGAIKTNPDYGAQTLATGLNTGLLIINRASDGNIRIGTSVYKPIVPSNQHVAAFYGLPKAAGDTTQSASSNAVGNYTVNAKSAISQMLNGSVAVTGTTLTITALPGIRYVCDEVTTLDITLPASGIVDVVFESGSTPTVLTITPPTGVTLKWANGFDPTSLDANTTYEINIADGLGVAASWT